MAHEIDTTAGNAAVFVTGQPAWHRLGTVIEQAATSGEAIGLAGLDWTVEQWPLRAFDPDEHAKEAGVPMAVANVRTDTGATLGVVGRRYRVFQNREAFDFMDALVGEKLAMYETAGALHGGRRVWMLARIPREHRAGPDDLIRPYVLLTNSHDGTGSLRMIPTTVRVVCQNTLTLALRGAGAEGLSVSHHPKLESRVREAREKLGVVAARFDAFDAELHAMLARDLQVTEAEAYFRAFSGVDREHTSERQRLSRERMHGAFLANFDNDRNTLPGVKHTAWAAYNAVSEWADHQQKVRGKTAAEKLNRRLDSVWFGQAHRLKQIAYRSALELAGAA